MKVFIRIFNILFPAVLMVLLIGQLQENIQKTEPDKQAVFLQVVLLLFGVGLILYRLINYNKSSR
jgi:hypothetical protein